MKLKGEKVRKALVVGIDYYESINCLNGCVKDSYSVNSILENNGDGTVNFDVVHLTATGENNKISRKFLKDKTIELFRDNSDVAVFYFAGHGFIEDTGGYLLTSDSVEGDDGFKLDELLKIANDSPAKSKVIILDSCHAGAAGSPKIMGDSAFIKEGITILSASGENQYALEIDGSGVFTTLLVDALEGGAANLVGDVTPGSVYAHIDQSLGAWEQRPVFKTNVKQFTNLRKVQPPITLQDLKKIIVLFPHRSHEFQLDPSFEPEGQHEKNEANIEKFRILQQYNRLNLVKPSYTLHMYHAAMESKNCRLTVLGAHYWNLVTRKRI